MMVWIMMLWFATQLKSPTWVYVVLVSMAVFHFLGWLVDVLEKVTKKQLEREREKLEELQRRVGSNRD